MKLAACAAIVVLSLAGSIPELRWHGAAEWVDLGPLAQPSSEVRLTFSPDGTRMLWGSISRTGGPGAWDIWERRRQGDAWSASQAVSFDSPHNDFDPFFAPDGKAVYFFSNRPGGSGGDDLYVAPFDAASGTYAPAQNLGPVVNSPGDEWAPTLSPDGDTLLFATDGRGGQGLHDLFVSRRAGGAWTAPEPLTELNSTLDDFDAAFLPDAQAVVFARRAKDQDGAELHVAFRHGGRYGAVQRLPPVINVAGTWTLGPSTRASEPGVLYFSSQRPGIGAGRMQIFRIRYEAVAGAPR